MLYFFNKQAQGVICIKFEQCMLQMGTRNSPSNYMCLSRRWGTLNYVNYVIFRELFYYCYAYYKWHRSEKEQIQEATSSTVVVSK